MWGRTLQNVNFLKQFIFFKEIIHLITRHRESVVFIPPQHSSQVTVEVDNESVNIFAPLSF